MSFENPVVGGEDGELIREAIHSPDYVPGVSGWTINRDGSAEFNNVDIRLDLNTGSITVGAAGGPQVVIRASTGGAGIIQLPTNQTFERQPPQISGDYSTSPDRVFLMLDSGFTNDAFGDPTVNSTMTLGSGNDGTGTGSYFDLTTSGTGYYGNLYFDEFEGYIYHDVLLRLDGSQVRINDEVYVKDDDSSGNFPERVVRGKVVTSSTNTALSKVSDTLIAIASGTILETGIAYEVDVQLRTNATVGTSAAGTQLFFWKLWDGAVGGTQLGATIQTTNTSVGTVSGTQKFTFLFKHTGTSGSRTLSLSGIHNTGADTYQATVSTQFYLTVRRVGDPANITNL